jgi:hypothetical protein
MANLKLKENLTIQSGSTSFIDVLPVTGHILPFAGPSNKIPSGWVLCDGTNGTPNLIGKIPGGVSNISVGSNQTHSHSFTHALSNFNSTTVVDSATTGTFGQSANNSPHSHGGSAGINVNAWGNTGPANRSNGTQANVIGMNHTHGGTTSGSTGIGTGNANAGHTHNQQTGATIDGTSGNTHSHPIPATPTSPTSNVSHTALPSIFYVNFIMKV